MKKALELTQTGHGQIVAVVGGPGVGKSRLFHEFKLGSQRGSLVLETFSVSHGKAYAYLPLIDLLKGYFHITFQDDDRRIREKVTGKVFTLDRSLEDTLPYLFALLSVSEPNSSLHRRQRSLTTAETVHSRENRRHAILHGRDGAGAV